MPDRYPAPHTLQYHFTMFNTDIAAVKHKLSVLTAFIQMITFRYDWGMKRLCTTFARDKALSRLNKIVFITHQISHLITHALTTLSERPVVSIPFNHINQLDLRTRLIDLLSCTKNAMSTLVRTDSAKRRHIDEMTALAARLLRASMPTGLNDSMVHEIIDEGRVAAVVSYADIMSQDDITTQTRHCEAQMLDRCMMELHTVLDHVCAIPILLQSMANVRKILEDKLRALDANRRLVCVRKEEDDDNMDIRRVRRHTMPQSKCNLWIAALTLIVIIALFFPQEG